MNSEKHVKYPARHSRIPLALYLYRELVKELMYKAKASRFK
jgi:hypothetical protein